MYICSRGVNAYDAGPVAVIVPNKALARNDVGWVGSCNRGRSAGPLQWSAPAGLRPAAPTWWVQSPPGATRLCPDYRYHRYN